MVIYKDDILMLRTWRAADAASLAANADDITLWNNVRDLFPHPYTLADAREFIAAAAGKPCPVDFAVVAGGKAVGGVGFVPGTDVERFGAEIGFWLGSRCRGRGGLSPPESASQILRAILRSTRKCCPSAFFALTSLIFVFQ